MIIYNELDSKEHEVGFSMYKVDNEVERYE